MKIGKEARVCIIGAGPSGITAAKHLLQVGHTNFVVYDKNGEVGGNWLYSPEPTHSSVYESAHIISSRRMSQYHDFPMPEDYPDYPGHALLKDYFQNYARHFGVTDYIQFHTQVASAEKQADDSWRITLGDGRIEHFDHLIVASGHHWNPQMPQYPGEFTGEMLHSHYYKNSLPFRGKRVLVIGGGNSACDIVCDICRITDFAALSWRRGYYVIPKIVFGEPPDVVNAKFAWLPRGIRKRTTWLMWWLLTGGNARYGLPKPDHDILDTHPVANSQLLYYLRHGDIHPRKDIARLDGKTVHFVDGTAEEYDVIIAGTGYRITFPFFDTKIVDFSSGDVPLYLRVFPAEHPTLYFIGLLQPQGCIWPLADTQAQIVAHRITGNYQLPTDLQARIEQEIAVNKQRYTNAARHSLEVEYHDYLNRLFREVPANAPQWQGVPARKMLQPQPVSGD